MHKETHTAVIIDCWSTVLGEITFENKPTAFDKLIRFVKEHAIKKNKELQPLFGLEDTKGFGRALASYLIGHKYVVKSINPALANEFRKSAPTYKKNDSYDALAVAKVLRDLVDSLPDAKHEDIYFTIRQLTKRRDSIKKRIAILQHQLHDQLMHVYPSYKKFFSEVVGKTALFFWENYPSPQHVINVEVETLASDLRKASRNACSTKKANEIINLIASDGVNVINYQNARDYIVKSIVKEFKHNQENMAEIEEQLKHLIDETGYQLDTMTGINLVTAAHLISEIGDVNRFPNADKLASFAGIAPVNFSSAGKGSDKRSRQGNRNLNAIFYFLAVQMVQVSSSGVPRNKVFYEYFQRKVSEGKSKPQALVCIQRRLVRIIYGIMKNKTAYVPHKKN